MPLATALVTCFGWMGVASPVSAQEATPVPSVEAPPAEAPPAEASPAAPAAAPPEVEATGAAPSEKRSEMRAILDRVAADEAHRGAVKEPTGNAEGALERASGARAAGDASHAALLEALALEWAKTAEDLVRAIVAEAKAMEAAKRAAELESKVERARALLAETQARRGQARAELARLEEEAARTVRETQAKENARVDQSKKGKSRKGGAP